MAQIEAKVKFFILNYSFIDFYYFLCYYLVVKV